MNRYSSLHQVAAASQNGHPHLFALRLKLKVQTHLYVTVEVVLSLHAPPSLEVQHYDYLSP